MHHQIAGESASNVERTTPSPAGGYRGRATRRRWPRRLDHYDWLTAYFAAREMQKTACRVVAMIILCLGAILLTLMASSVGPHGLRDQVLAVSVALCCLVMGVLWLR